MIRSVLSQAAGRVWLPVVLWAAAMAVARPAAAQLVPGWNTKQFTLERIDADRVRLMREVEIEGEPGSPNAGQKFFADDLELNTKTGELTANGNVVFSTPTQRISAETVTFNTHTKLGTFSNASGIAQLGDKDRGVKDRSMFGTLEPDVYFYGTTIEKVGPDKYRITRGGFTTCVQPTPRWQIVSAHATVNLHDYAILRNAVVQVKHVPVFYLPVLYYPIQDDDRSTGFLIPTYGRSTYRGQSISNAFFWAISRSQDLTLMHDWFFSRGQGMGPDYRYLFGPQSQGAFKAYWLNEKASVLNGVSLPERRSSQYTGNLTQGLPGKLTGRVRVEYFTDVTVQQLYNNNFYDASRSTRTFGGGVSGSWHGLSANTNVQRTEYFYSQTDSYVSGSAPAVNLNYSGRKLGPLPVYASLTAEANQLVYIQKSATSVNDLSLFKMDLLPSLRAPLSTLPFLSVNTSIGYRTTYFSESLDARGRQVEVPVSRKYADMRADVIGPVFSKVYSPNNAMADRLKHILEPSFSVQRTTSINTQNRIPNSAGGGYDTIVGGTTRFSYGLSNRLLVRKLAAGADARASAPREFLSVSLRQSYYTDAKASQYDNSYSFGYLYRPANPYSPISLVARGMPIDAAVIDFRLEYDPTLNANPKMVGFGMNGSVRKPNGDATVGWSRRAYGGGSRFTSADYLQSSGSVRFRHNTIGGNASFNYDIARATLVQHRWTAYYNAQCCGLAFDYQSFNYANLSNIPVPRDRRFNLSFTLAGVGSFSNFLGAFGGGAY